MILMDVLGVIPRLIRNLFSKPLTVRFPYESIPIPEGYRGEHKYEIEKCISCGICAKVCPNRAIEMVDAPETQKDTYSKTYPKIDLGKCCFCRLCEDVCPTDAITLTKNFFLATFDQNTTIKDPFAEKEH